MTGSWRVCVRNISKHHKAQGFQDVADCQSEGWICSWPVGRRNRSFLFSASKSFSSALQEKGRRLGWEQATNDQKQLIRFQPMVQFKNCGWYAEMLKQMARSLFKGDKLQQPWRCCFSLQFSCGLNGWMVFESVTVNSTNLWFSDLCFELV